MSDSSDTVQDLNRYYETITSDDLDAVLAQDSLKVENDRLSNYKINFK